MLSLRWRWVFSLCRSVLVFQMDWVRSPCRNKLTSAASPHNRRSDLHPRVERGLSVLLANGMTDKGLRHKRPTLTYGFTPLLRWKPRWQCSEGAEKHTVLSGFFFSLCHWRKWGRGITHRKIFHGTNKTCYLLGDSSEGRVVLGQNVQTKLEKLKQQESILKKMTKEGKKEGVWGESNHSKTGGGEKGKIWNLWRSRQP